MLQLVGNGDLSMTVFMFLSSVFIPGPPLARMFSPIFLSFLLLGNVTVTLRS